MSFDIKGRYQKIVTAWRSDHELRALTMKGILALILTFWSNYFLNRLAWRYCFETWDIIGILIVQVFVPVAVHNFGWSQGSRVTRNLCYRFFRMVTTGTDAYK